MGKKIIKHIVVILIALSGTFLYANDPQEQLIKNSADQLNYLYDYNNQQIKAGNPDKQWFIYFLGGTLKELKNIMDETNTIGDAYMSSLNDKLEVINSSANTVAYVAFTKYEGSLTTPLFPKEYNTLQLQQTYVNNFFAGWNESNIESFSMFTSRYQEVIEKIYESTWLNNLEKENVLLPFSMFTERLIISKNPEDEISIKQFQTYHLYAPSIQNDFNKGVFQQLYKDAIPLIGQSAIEQKMEKAVSAIEEYFINGERPEYKECAEQLNSDKFKKIVEDIGNPNDIWIQLIEDNPCLLNEIYPLGREYVDSSQFERELMIFVCVPLAIAFTVPAMALAGEAAIIALVRQIGAQKVKDASLAMLYNGLIQMSSNYYFDENVGNIENSKERFLAASESVSEKDIAIEGLKELATPKLKGKAAIACILQGITFEGDKWYGGTEVDGFDFSKCGQAIFEEYAGFIIGEAASPLLKRLKLLITNNPRQFLKGLRELMRDAELAPEIKESFFNSFRSIIEDLDEANIFNINIDIEEAFSDAAKEFAEDSGYNAAKNANIPIAQANFNFENVIKDAATDLEQIIRNIPSSDISKLGANITLSYGNIDIRVPLIAELKDGGYKIIFAVDKNVSINTLDDLLRYTSNNQQEVLNAFKNGKITSLRLKGEKAQDYLGNTNIDVPIKEIEVYTKNGDGSLNSRKLNLPQNQGLFTNILGKVSALPNARIFINRLNETDDFDLLQKIDALSETQLQKLDELYDPSRFQLPGNRPDGALGDFTTKTRNGEHDIYFDKNGFPDLESFSAGAEYNYFSESLVGNQATSDFTAANNNLLNNPSFEGKVRPVSAKPTRIQIKSDAGEWIEYIWHHHQDGKTLQPIIADVHEDIAHIGGGNSTIINFLKGLFYYE